MSLAKHLKGIQIGTLFLGEKDVLTLYYLVRGMTAKEISAQISASRRSVEYCVSKVKKELDCHSRSRLIGTLLDMGFPATNFKS